MEEPWPENRGINAEAADSKASRGQGRAAGGLSLLKGTNSWLMSVVAVWGCGLSIPGDSGCVLFLFFFFFREA